MNTLLTDILAEAADRRPDHEAVRCGGRSLTYGELATASDGVAAALVDAGVNRGDRVAILLPKCVEALAAVYGVMKSGAAYVPLDLRAPVSRLAAVANDCGVAALIATRSGARRVSPSVSREHLRVVLTVPGDDDATGPDTVPEVTYDEALRSARPAPTRSSSEDDLAYILYTSGSTGRPKGVMLSHRNALAFVEWAAGEIGVREDDRLSNHAPLHFDLSVFDLFAAARGGATVALVPDAEAFLGTSLARFVGDEAITVWYSVPSAVTLMAARLRGPDEVPHLRAVVFAGEVFPSKQLARVMRLLQRASFWNWYGPTETNVCTSYRVPEPPSDRPVPIGRACGSAEVYALRGDGSVAAMGEEGELYVRGATVMKGYWGRPRETAEALVRDPLRPEGSDRVYRTGDIVKLNADGDYDFVGRRDHQVKSRGYRIELGEIEAAVLDHPGVAEAAAAAVPNEEWGSAIVAWVVPAGDESVTAKDLRRHLADRLPRYMVPADIRVVGSLPRTSTGKVDRRRLAGDAGPDRAEATG